MVTHPTLADFFHTQALEALASSIINVFGLERGSNAPVTRFCHSKKFYIKRTGAPTVLDPEARIIASKQEPSVYEERRRARLNLPWMAKAVAYRLPSRAFQEGTVSNS
jgi:hypothetical protein